MNYRFLTPALAEIREASEFYEQRVSGLGADFLDEVDAAIARIIQFPEASLGSVPSVSQMNWSGAAFQHS